MKDTSLLGPQVNVRLLSVLGAQRTTLQGSLLRSLHCV